MIELLKKIYIFIYNSINFFKKRSQKVFYEYEKYNKYFNINGIKYFNFNYFIFSEKKLLKTQTFTKNLKKKYKDVIIIINKKTSDFFSYKLNNKIFKRFTLNNSVNFLKINLKNKNNFRFEVDKEDLVFNPIFSKDKKNKKLVLIFIVDGLGNDFTNLMKNTNNYFGRKNRFVNAWSNGEWTLPSVGNLLSGKYTSNHLCYNQLSYYKSIFNLSNKIEAQTNLKVKNTIFESFKNLNFITGFYSPYLRINPTYGHDRGVDIFKHCIENSVDEILENVRSQLEFFNNHSNFIIAHIFDTHGPTKKYLRLSEQSLSGDKNYNFKSSGDLQNLFPKNMRVRDKYQSVMLENLFRYVDNRLEDFFKYLNKKKFDDYSIILLGDHGTRRIEKNKTNKVLSKMQNNIGFYIKDKKFKFASKRKKTLQVVDIFPSLLSRYSKKNTLRNNGFDGKNILYSSEKTKFPVSESIWGGKYNFFLKTNNYSALFTYSLDNLQKIKEVNYFDYKEKKIDEENIPKKDLSEIKQIFNNFKKSKKIFK